MERSALSGKYARLKNILSGMGSLIVAFSGGVDSTFLLKAASDTLGGRVLAITADSPIRPRREIARAKETARAFGARHIIVKSDELRDNGILNNTIERCYLCKKRIFSRLLEIAAENGMAFVAEGSNADDLNRFRPGEKALEELRIRSPLREAGLSKGEIRNISKEQGLEVWDMPSQTCFLTRFPYNTRIDVRELDKLQRAEEFLSGLGFREVRVRVLGDSVSVEVSGDQTGLLADPGISRLIRYRLRKLGYPMATFDPKGYRSGSMDEGMVWTKKE